MVDSSGKAQMQPLLHGWLALQLPPQAKPWASLRNCRAESDPALRTAMTRVEKSIVLTVLCMPCSFLTTLDYFPGVLDDRPSPGRDPEQNPMVLPSSGKTQSQGKGHPLKGPPGEKKPHVKPPQDVRWGWLRNCRAERVPAPRVAASIATSNKLLMIFLLIFHSPCD